MKNLTNEKAQKVEKLAAKLLTTASGSHAYEALKNDLTLAVMAYKGMEDFDGQHFHEGKTLEDSRGYFSYSGLVLVEALNFAMREYGKTDNKTGKVIPFCQLLNHALKLKASDVAREKYADRDRLDQHNKKSFVEAYLRRLCKEKGLLAAELKFNVLNKKAVTSFMEKHGFSDDEMDTVLSLIETNYVSNDGFNADDECDDKTVQVTDLKSYKDYQASQVYISGAYGTIDKLLAQAGKSKEGRALKQWITFQCFEKGLEDDESILMLFEDYFDPEFFSFLGSHREFEKADRAVVAFTGNKLDTVQKSMSAARNMLEGKKAAKKKETVGSLL